MQPDASSSPPNPQPSPQFTPPSPAPTPEPIPVLPRPVRHRSPMAFLGVVGAVMLAGFAAFGVYTWQQSRVTSLQREVATLHSEMDTKQKQEAAAKSDDTVVLSEVKDYCEGQLSLDSKLPRKFTAVTVNGRQVRYGGDKKFAQVLVDCRNVSDTDPLAKVPYILKKTNDHWYVVYAYAEGDPAASALFGIPGTFDE